ncbi:hypothetical protein LEMLEM_LOCUS20159, partial [Lemmus lemmus]
ARNGSLAWPALRGEWFFTHRILRGKVDENSQGRAFLSIVGQAFRSCGELFEESLGSELLNRKGQDFSNQCCACS